eukprot:c28284_g1_i2 orf=956-2380(+)
MRSMYSKPSLSEQNGKEEYFGHVNSPPEAPSLRSSSGMQECNMSCPSPAFHQTPSHPNTGSTCRALIPYTPSISPPFPIASGAQMVTNGSCQAAIEAELDLEEAKKREKEHKKRSKNWTQPETLKLIKLRRNLAPRFAKAGRKIELWDEIAEALQSRDAQQCKDKWEKLMAGYKEVREGLKKREDNPFFEELHPLLSGNSSRKAREREGNSFGHENAGEIPTQGVGLDSGGELNSNGSVKYEEKHSDPKDNMRENVTASKQVGAQVERKLQRKRKRVPKYIAVTDLQEVQMLIETILSRQQHFFAELLDTMERREQLREEMRAEREENWRAEERAQRCIFNNAMLVLTQKLVSDRGIPAPQEASGPLVCSPVGDQGLKKRSRNWKRAEVLQLIKLRGEMENKFAKSTRRAALWDEIAESLVSQGVKREGKQCREKWDKLMSEFKDVRDGKREEGDSPYFTELTAVVGRKPGDAG